MQHPLLVGLGLEPRIWMKRDFFGLSLFASILKDKGVRNNAQEFVHCFVVVVPLFPDCASSRRILQQLVVLNRSEEHTSELQSHSDLVCRLLLEKKKKKCTNAFAHYLP